MEYKIQTELLELLAEYMKRDQFSQETIEKCDGDMKRQLISAYVAASCRELDRLETDLISTPKLAAELWSQFEK